MNPEQTCRNCEHRAKDCITGQLFCSVLFANNQDDTVSDKHECKCPSKFKAREK